MSTVYPLLRFVSFGVNILNSEVQLRRILQRCFKIDVNVNLLLQESYCFFLSNEIYISLYIFICIFMHTFYVLFLHLYTFMLYFIRLYKYIAFYIYNIYISDKT